MSAPLPDPFWGPAGGILATPRQSHPGFERALAVAREARSRPGEWVDLATFTDLKQAQNKLSGVRYRPNVAFQPVGSFEARKESRDGKHVVQVRYVGGVS